jgi:hypothetical protein
MSFATQSGMYNTENFQQILITQGLSGCTLVTRKKVLFRLFVSESLINIVDRMLIRVTYNIFGSSFKKDFLFPKNSFFIESSVPNGPSIGIILDGKTFPIPLLTYKIDFYGYSTITHFPNILFHFTTPELKFLPSGNLRILAKPLESLARTAPWGNKILSNITWLLDLFESLTRLGAMLPVSDGISFGSNPNPLTGLSYIIGEKLDAWPEICPKGAPPSMPDEFFPNFLVCDKIEMRDEMVQEAIKLKSMGIRVDVTLVWRQNDPMKPPDPRVDQYYVGEIPGGHADVVSKNRLARVVGGKYRDVPSGVIAEMTAPTIAQEIAHTFGAESTDSPNYDGGGHSNRLVLADPYAFDFVRLRHYLPYAQGLKGRYLGDVMSLAVWQGRDSTMFSAYDWEYLRKKLIQLPDVANEITEQSDPEKVQKKAIEELQISFSDLQIMKVDNPESTLSSKPGFDWHWTDIGFQLLKTDEQKRGYGLTQSVEAIFSGLKKLGVKEVFAPIDGKPKSIAINPNSNISMRCEIDDSCKQV